MNVSSVKNLNGEVFSAVQDASLTNVVQTNSGNWQDITAYQNASATYLTAVDFSPYATTAEVDTLSSMLSGAIDYVSANAGDEFPVSADEAIQYVQTNSGTIDDTVTSYQTNSGTFLTAHQAISANEWNSNYETVNTNSGVWGGSALPISAGPGIKVNLVDNTLVFSNDETVLYDRQGQYDANLTSVSVSEPLSSFDCVRFYDSKGGVVEKHFPSTDESTQYIRFAHYSQTLLWASIWKVNESNYTEITGNIGSLTNCLSGVVTGTPTEAGAGSPYNRWVIPMKIVGINRK
jgi:hypothetical protein